MPNPAIHRQVQHRDAAKSVTVYYALQLGQYSVEVGYNETTGMIELLGEELPPMALTWLHLPGGKRGQLWVQFRPGGEPSGGNP